MKTLLSTESSLSSSLFLMHMHAHVHTYTHKRCTTNKIVKFELRVVNLNSHRVILTVHVLNFWN